MVRSEREHLFGNVEVDAVVIGGVEHGGKTRRSTRKRIVGIAVEVSPRGWAGAHAPHPGCIGFPPTAICLRQGNVRLDGSHGWLERIQPAVRVRLHAQEGHGVFLG